MTRDSKIPIATISRSIPDQNPQATITQTTTFRTDVNKLPNPGAKIVWLVINYLRRAEVDYLAGRLKKKIHRSAWDSLFGLSQSAPFNRVCALLDIDPVAAKLAIIRARLRGENGDPVFGFLLEEDCMDRVQCGLPLDKPTLEKLQEAHGDATANKPKCCRKGSRRYR